MCMFFMLNMSQGNQNYSINFFIKPSRLWKSLTADPCNSVRITPHPTGSYRPSPANTPRPYFTRVYGNRCKPFLLWASTGASIWRENPRIPAIICGWVAYFWPINSPCFVSVSLKVMPLMEVAVWSGESNWVSFPSNQTSNWQIVHFQFHLSAYRISSVANCLFLLTHLNPHKAECIQN